MESPLAFVVRVILEPATNVKVSVAESATTSDWPETDMVLKASETLPPPPPPPAASEADVKLPPPTIRCPKEAVEVDEPLSIVPSKVKLDSTVASSESLKVRIPLDVPPSKDIPPPPPPPPAAAIVTLSPLASVVNVTFEPATKVRVSVDESATLPADWAFENKITILVSAVVSLSVSTSFNIGGVLPPSAISL